MNFLPKDIEDIIIDYKEGMEKHDQLVEDLFNNMNTTGATYAAADAYFNAAYYDGIAVRDTLIAATTATDITAAAAAATTFTATVTAIAAAAADARDIYDAAVNTYNIAYVTTDAYFDAAKK